MNSEHFVDWRRRTGLTQEKAAEKFGVTRTTIQNWESGGTPIPVAVEAGCQIWEQRLRQEDPNVGPVTLVYADGPMFVNPYGPRRRTAMMHQEPYPTNAAALARVQALWGRDYFHNALVIEQSGKPLWNIVELEAVVTGSYKGAPTIPNMLRALAEQVRSNSAIFVRSGPKMLDPTTARARQQTIEKLANEFDHLAARFSPRTADYAKVDKVLLKLRELGQHPEDMLVNNIAQAFVTIALPDSVG